MRWSIAPAEADSRIRRTSSAAPDRLRWLVISALFVLATSAFVLHERQRGRTVAELFARRAVRVDADGASAALFIGDSTAPVRITVFVDFECVHCRRMYEMLAAERARAPRSFAVIYRHFPLSGVGNALPAAIAAECAADQGRFDAYATMIFNAQTTMVRALSDSAARRAGIPDIGHFNACRISNSTRQRIASDIRAGEKIGVLATPTLVIGTQLFVGELTRDELADAIRAAAPGLTRP